MKVCAVTTWPPHHDGVALYSAELYNEAANLVDVEVVANGSPQQDKHGRSKTKEGNVVGYWRRGILYPLRVFHSVFKTGCNVVHLQHGWLLYGGQVSSLLFPVLLCFFRLSRKPCVVTMHTVIRGNAKIYSNFLVNFLSRVAVSWVTMGTVNFSDKVIVHNQLMKNVLQKEYLAKEEKVVIISHGVKQSSNKTEALHDNKMYILSLGFLRKEKRIECLLEAFKKVVDRFPNTELVIVGGSHAHDKSDYSEEIKRNITAELMKQVEFTGFVDDKTLEQLIGRSNIVVLQSTESYYVEASGTLAAVANYGKAVVCSRVPKFQSELQNGKNCIFVEPSNSTELAQALVLLMEDKELRKRLGDNLKERFKNRNWGAAAKQHILVYRSVVR